MDRDANNVVFYLFFCLFQYSKYITTLHEMNVIFLLDIIKIDVFTALYLYIKSPAQIFCYIYIYLREVCEIKNL